MNKKPNILFIMVDQWRAECFGFLGHPVIKTPNIDRLAQGAVWFKNAHTVTPLCSPARGCLLTAKWPHINGVIDNVGVGISKQEALDPSVLTWLDAAIESGYKTGYFGKWHLGGGTAESKDMEYNSITRDRRGPEPQGWSPATERGEMKAEAAEKYMSKPVFPGDKPPFYARLSSGVEKMTGHKTAECALDFLKRSDERPWYLTVSFHGPHFPHTIPEPYAGMYNPYSVELPKNLYDRFIMKPWFQNRHWWPSMITEHLTEDDWRKCAAAYYGYITLLDNEIGRVLDAADEASGGRKTIVLFTADHGEMLGAHSRFDKGPYMYEEVMRIPLLIQPNLTEPEKQKCTFREEYCSIIDVGTTLFHLAGAGGKPYQLEGRSLMPLIDDSSEDLWPEEAFGAYYRYNGHSFEVRMITTPEWKYSYIPQDIDELYNLKTDPGEMLNLADNPVYAGVKERLKTRLLKWMEQNSDPLPENIKHLPSAGSYVE